MDRDQLKRWLDQGLSLPQIGVLVGRDPSTVGYWVQKHGLIANGRGRYAPRGGLRREQLSSLVEQGATVEEIADALDRCTSTVRHWMRKFGLKTQRHHRHRSAALAALRSGQTRFMSTCARHGETEFLAFSDGHSRCARCNSEAVAKRRRKVKRILAEEAGGRCALCGYDRCIAALHFHHLDPGQKSFSLSHQGVTRSLEKAREEAGKCLLLCSNCHAEVEAGFAVLPIQLEAVSPG
jgi:transposase-like protein